MIPPDSQRRTPRSAAPAGRPGAAAPARRRGRRGAAYAVAAGAVAVAVAATVVLWDLAFSRNQFALLYAAVIVSAWYGGLRPGLAAAAASVWAMGYFLVPSLLSWHHAGHFVTTAAGFALVAALVSGLETLRARAARAAEQAREAAEAANRAKDELLAMLSHELRTPLTPALAVATALAADPSLPAAARDDLEVVRRNIALEARLIDDLLDLTRVASGKLHLRRERADALDLLRQAVDVCRADAAAKRIELVADLAGGRSTLDADPARVVQVVWNLLKNAVKFTPAGGRVSVTARFDPAADGGGGPGTLRVDVADTGIGIDPDLLARVFEPFEQGDRAAVKDAGGVGLGLTIGRAVAAAHGGTLTASSAGRGAGATFTLRLPAEPAVDAVVPTPAPVERPPPGGPAGPVRPTRVLLVEDHADTARVMARLLRSTGYEVRTAASVAEGLAASAEAPVDLLVSDLGLPDGTGCDLLRELTARDGTAPPAIAMSGYGMERDMGRSAAAGFAAHLVKPVAFAALDAAIRDLVGTPERASA